MNDRMGDVERGIRVDAFPAGLAPVLANDPTARAVFKAGIAARLGVVETLTVMVVELSEERERLVERLKEFAGQCTCGAFERVAHTQEGRRG